MEKLTVRPAQLSDLPRIMDIYDIARRFMRANGNPTQWNNGYPWADLLADDIAAGQLFVVEDMHQFHGVFAFIIGPDKTYAYIEDGAWHGDGLYGTIHRIAGDGTGGIFRTALDFCRSRSTYLRVDTHADNKPMQHLVTKAGFRRCGIIYVEDGTPRIAYDFSGV